MRSEYRHPGTLADNLQLVDCRRPLKVTGHQKRCVSLPAKAYCQFASQRCLAGSLQAGQHHYRRWFLSERQLAGLAAEDADQFFVDDLDNLVGRVESSRYFGTPSAFFDPVHKRPHHRQRNVGFKQRQPDFAGGGLDISVSQPAFAAQPL